MPFASTLRRGSSRRSPPTAWARSCARRARRRGTSAAAAAISRWRRASGSTAVASHAMRSSLSSWGKCRHWAATSAGPSAAPVKPRGMHVTDLVPVRRALISLSDKSGLDELAAGLAKHGVEIVSTGGTAAKLRGHGADVRDVSDLTGFPEMMDGRVKTLHPKVHGGLLGVRDNPEHAAAMAEHGIAPIDLVVVNLYPFLSTVMSGAGRDTVIENVDIGGPSMVRSAAKNHPHVAVVTDPADYAGLLTELDVNGGATTLQLRRKLAAKAYALTAEYDSTISQWFAFADQRERWPARWTRASKLKMSLRYC